MEWQQSKRRIPSWRHVFADARGEKRLAKLQLVGGAKKHGEVNYTLEAPVHYTVVDKANPIMKDMTDLTLSDEAFFLMTWAKDPGIHILANAEIAATPSASESAPRTRISLERMRQLLLRISRIFEWLLAQADGAGYLYAPAQERLLLCR